jgi:hypothetical protein
MQLHRYKLQEEKLLRPRDGHFDRVSGQDLARRDSSGGGLQSRWCHRGDGRAVPWGATLGLAVAAVDAAARGRQHLGIARVKRQKEDQEEGADHLGSHLCRLSSCFRANKFVTQELWTCGIGVRCAALGLPPLL